MAGIDEGRALIHRQRIAGCWPLAADRVPDVVAAANDTRMIKCDSYVRQLQQ